jgi:hypothetical protein
MDPLDQRLTDAGLAWRQTQPEPPRLDPMLIALRQARSSRFQGRLMFAFIASLLLVAAVAIAPGVGSFLQGLPPRQPPVVVPSSVPSPIPTEGPATPRPSAPSPEPTATPTAPARDAAAARAIVDQYERALVEGRWSTAFDLLATTSLTHEAGLETYSTERAQFFASAGSRYTVGEPGPVSDWTGYGQTVAGADHAHAWLVEVDYPALAGNNAGFEQFVVAWDASGSWRIWPVR